MSGASNGSGTSRHSDSPRVNTRTTSIASRWLEEEEVLHEMLTTLYFPVVVCYPKLYFTTLLDL